MDKIILIVACFVLVVSCSTKPDYSAEIKTIDSLQTEVKKYLEESRKIDTSWISPVSVNADNIITDIKQYYNPDSIIQEDVQIISYYKGYRKVGKRFRDGKRKLESDMKLSLKQLEDLKTDAENGALKKEELHKYLGEEKLVTTELIYQFKDMKYSTEELLRNYDSLTPLILDIVKVYRGEEKDTVKVDKRKKRGRTIHY